MYNPSILFSVPRVGGLDWWLRASYNKGSANPGLRLDCAALHEGTLARRSISRYGSLVFPPPPKKKRTRNREGSFWYFCQPEREEHCICQNKSKSEGPHKWSLGVPVNPSKTKPCWLGAARPGKCIARTNTCSDGRPSDILGQELCPPCKDHLKRPCSCRGIEPHERIPPNKWLPGSRAVWPRSAVIPSEGKLLGTSSGK